MSNEGGALAPSPDKARYTVTLDRSELAVRMIEAATGRARPLGQTADECLECLGANKADWLLAAQAAIAYMHERLEAAETVN